jgi:hypothetical protein
MALIGLATRSFPAAVFGGRSISCGMWEPVLSGPETQRGDGQPKAQEQHRSEPDRHL